MLANIGSFFADKSRKTILHSFTFASKSIRIRLDLYYQNMKEKGLLEFRVETNKFIYVLQK